MAARELGEVVIVVPIERGDLFNGWREGGGGGGGGGRKGKGREKWL